MTEYVTVSIPKPIADDIDRLIEELGYWPSRSSFTREALINQVMAWKMKLKQLREEAPG